MIYNLTNPLHRSQFVKRANALLRKHSTIVLLEDRSQRTVNQNKYLHVLCRIMACETGVTEDYAKETYFKAMSNFNIFQKEITDPVTQSKTTVLRSTKDLTVQEMSKAIYNFIRWAEELGYYLPEATIQEDGSVEFNSKKDEDAFKQAEVETGRFEKFL